MTDVDTYDADQPGIDRRTIIKRAAAAGAVAWTAPLILDSIASPAGAITAGPCDFYVFKMTRTGGSCAAVIQTVAQCPTPTITGASTACTSFTRQTSTTSPVNFTVTGCAEGGGNETATFTINTTGRIFVGQAKSGPLATCAASVVLAAGSSTQTQTVSQTGVANGDSWWAYLAVGFA